MRELNEPGLPLPRIRDRPTLVTEQPCLEELSGIATQFTSTNGPSARGPARCIVRATRPLPVPVSPRMRIAGGCGAVAARFRTCSSCARNRWIPALSPTMSPRTRTGRILSQLSRTIPR
jgi:hypothetical protein